MRDINQAIGKADGIFACENGDCGCTAHDVIDEYKGIWLVECFVCGTKVRMPAVKGVSVSKKAGSDFVFRDGRFAGIEISEVASLEVGMEYLKWAAEEHPRNFVKEACRSWLDSQKVAR